MNRSDARKILGHEPQKTFRKLSKEHHPDHGGDPELFRKLRDAYEALTKEPQTAEYDLLAQLFLQELDIPIVFSLLDTMEAKSHETIKGLPKKLLKLQQARPKAKGFLITVLESAIHDIDDERIAAQTSISEITKARELLKNLYT